MTTLQKASYLARKYFNTRLICLTSVFGYTLNIQDYYANYKFSDSIKYEDVVALADSNEKIIVNNKKEHYFTTNNIIMIDQSNIDIFDNDEYPYDMHIIMSERRFNHVPKHMLDRADKYPAVMNHKKIYELINKPNIFINPNIINGLNYFDSVLMNKHDVNLIYVKELNSNDYIPDNCDLYVKNMDGSDPTRMIDAIKSKINFDINYNKDLVIRCGPTDDIYRIKTI